MAFGVLGSSCGVLQLKFQGALGRSDKASIGFRIRDLGIRVGVQGLGARD